MTLTRRKTLTLLAATGLFAGSAGLAPAQEAAAELDTSTIVEMALGAEDAPVTLYEYASFTCPHCASFHLEKFPKLKAEYIDTGKLRLIYRDVYFDRFGLWASMVARCGGEERFFGITEMLYHEQKEWIGEGDPVTIADNLRRIGKLAGLDEATLDSCLSDDVKAKTLVAWYQENAKADGINSTPSLVLNGERHNNLPYEELKALIDAALEG